MNTEEIIKFVIAVLSGLAASIPLVVKLVKFVKLAMRDKRNMAKLVSLISALMSTAEEKFEKGAERREWVISMVMTSSTYLEYPVDAEAIGEMVDELCDMSKHVNVGKDHA